MTPAEERVLELLRQGLPNAEIAVRLGISINIVRFHVANLLAKADAADRKELARWRPAEPGPLRRWWAALPLAVKWASPVVALAGGAAFVVVALVSDGPDEARPGPLPDGLVSVAMDGSPGNGQSMRSVMSADGRFVAFESEASNLVPGDTNGVMDVFLRDRLKGTTVRVSVGPGGEQGNAKSENPAISADGRFVAFESLATNLVPRSERGDDEIRTALAEAWTSGDPGGGALLQQWLAVLTRTNVYLRDIREGKTELVSKALDGGAGNLGSVDPTISADGRFVAFSSAASNLVKGDTNAGKNGIAAAETLVGLGGVDVFVRYRNENRTSRVSVTSDGTEAEGSSGNPSISPDGRWVAFVSDAQNLVPQLEGIKNLHLHDQRTGETRYLPVARPPEGGMIFTISRPSFSADSRSMIATTDYHDWPSTPPSEGQNAPGRRRKVRFWLYDLSSGALDLALERFNVGGQLWPAAITDDRLIAGWGAQSDSEPSGLFFHDLGAQSDLLIRPGPIPDPPFRFSTTLAADGRTLSFVYPQGTDPEGRPIYQVWAQRP